MKKTERFCKNMSPVRPTDMGSDTKEEIPCSFASIGTKKRHEWDSVTLFFPFYHKRFYLLSQLPPYILPSLSQ